MTYDAFETSTAEGRPLFLYRFTEGTEFWRFTSRSADWVVPGGTFADEPGDTTWAASAVSHGNVVQSGDPRRVTKTGSAQTSDPANDPDEDDPADDSDTDPAQADQQD